MAELTPIVTLTTISSTRANEWQARLVQRYSSVANRTTEHPSPSEGDLAYLEDANALDVYTGAAWVPFIATNEVDGSVEVAGPVSIAAAYADVASVTLAIPAGWGSWKCEAWASYTGLATGTSGYVSLIRIDGTDQQGKGVTFAAGTGSDGSVGGRRTGMSTTGNRAVSLRFGDESGSVLVSDVYLYARAVRTS